MYSIDQVFQQALIDRESALLNSSLYQARLLRGIKIVRDNETLEIEIFNTTIGGDFYKEITPEQYKLF